MKRDVLLIMQFTLSTVCYQYNIKYSTALSHIYSPKLLYFSNTPLFFSLGPEIVENLTIQDFSTTSVAIVWQPPIGYAQSYMIQIVGDPSFVTNVTSLSAIIGKLTSGNYYIVLVSAVVEDIIAGDYQSISFHTGINRQKI